MATVEIATVEMENGDGCHHLSFVVAMEMENGNGCRHFVVVHRLWLPWRWKIVRGCRGDGKLFVAAIV